MASNLRVDSIVPATGSSVSIGTATGGVNIPGVLTYEDVTNVDSVGVITARSGIRIGATGANTLISGTATGIGIGTDSPQSTLEIAGSTHYQLALKDKDNLGDAAEAALAFKGSDNADLGLIGYNSWEHGDLKLQNSSSGKNIRFQTHNGTAIGERVRITSDGDVGIGTTGRTFGGDTPHTPALLISGNDYNKATLGLINYAADNKGTYIFLGKQRGGNAVQDDDNIGQLRFLAADGNDLNSSAAAIEVQVDGIVGVNSTPGRIKFKTTSPDSNSPTERLCITSGGNFKFANPPSGNIITNNQSTVYANAAINIYRLGNGYADMRLSSNYGAKVALAGASNNTDELTLIQDNQKNAYIANEADKEIYFQTNGSTRMTVAAGGNVGIGITNPSNTLVLKETDPVIHFIRNYGSGTSCLLYTSDAADE